MSNPAEDTLVGRINRFLGNDGSASVGYNDNFDPGQQVDLEEAISAAIFDFDYGEDSMRPSEDACNGLGRKILLMVMSQIRPDLVETVPVQA